MIFMYFSLKNVDSKKNDQFKLAFADTLPIGFSNVVLGVFSFMSIKKRSINISTYVTPCFAHKS